MGTTRRKVNFTIPADVAEKLRAMVGQRRRSSFVAQAIRDRLTQLERQELERALIEGYLARREEDAVLNREWEAATLEGWPR